MNFLLDNQADIMCKNQNGSNALHIATKKGNVEAVKMLLSMKFPVNEQKKNGITALGIACFKGNAEILEMLHKAGAILNSQTKKGISPLALAIKSQNFDCVKYLIDNKVDIMKSQIQNSEFSPIFLSIKVGNPMMLRYIYEHAGQSIDLDKIRT